MTQKSKICSHMVDMWEHTKTIGKTYGPCEMLYIFGTICGV